MPQAQTPRRSEAVPADGGERARLRHLLLDPQGNIQSWNPGRSASSNTRPTRSSASISRVLHAAGHRARLAGDELKRATSEGRFEDEGWRVRKDGSRFWAYVVITALRDPGGKLLAFSKITRDLSDRREQEEALRRSEERFRLLIEGVQDYAIYMLNPEGVITSWNEARAASRGMRRRKSSASTSRASTAPTTSRPASRGPSSRWRESTGARRTRAGACARTARASGRASWSPR
jgi:PAS domain S-box-containing protein